MLKINTPLMLSILVTMLFLSGACSGSSASPDKVSSQTVAPAASLPDTLPSAQPSAQQGAASTTSAPAGSATATSPAIPTLSTRVDVVYSHMNQRCPTCLCFEERINTVIEKYFGDAIASGKLTYKVVNAQDPLNGSFAKKFKAVGSQLFINTVVNGFDNIDDIQDIWNWDCRTNQTGFDLKVKNAIEQRLKGLT
jgi:hypothetical protein